MRIDPTRDVRLDLDSYRDNSYLTHNFHPYPAKFVPQIPRELIERLSRPGDWVVDPFCGSGTALVEANLLGRNALGIDINPLSCLISEVKTRVLSDRQLRDVKVALAEASECFSRKASFQIPKIERIDFWFSLPAQKDLATLLGVINRVKDDSVRDFLRVALSSIIVKVSNQESDTRYKAVSKPYVRGHALELFGAKVSDMERRMREFATVTKATSVLVLKADAATVDLTRNRVSLVVTSPPYMNSYDYYLYHKHRMSWLGMDHREAQEQEIGSRNKHNDKGLGVDAYSAPIRATIHNLRNVIAPGGHFCVIVGDAILRGELVQMNTIFDQLFSEEGFSKTREIKFAQRRYTRAFTPNLRTRHKHSYALIYRR